MILFCASLFSLIFDALGGKTLITNLLLSAPGDYVGFIIIANIAVFILGIPLEFTEICFIVMPLFVPAMEAMGIDKAWFSIVMAINLQTAFISPPVGFSLFYLQSTAPKEVSTADIHRSAIPFVMIQLVVLVLVIVFPQTVRWLIDVSAAMRQSAGGVQGGGGIMTIWLYTLIGGFVLVFIGRFFRRGRTVQLAG